MRSKRKILQEIKKLRRIHRDMKGYTAIARNEAYQGTSALEWVIRHSNWRLSECLNIGKINDENNTTNQHIV